MRYFLIKLCFIILALFLMMACHFLSVKNGEPQPNKQAIATLGQLFFFDTRLSANNTKSCATCHDPQFAFTDGYRKSMGIYADETQRNAPTLLNSRFLSSLTYADPNIRNYYQQMQKPLFSQHPPELGLNKSDINVLNRFRNDSMYKAIFNKAFSIKNTG